MGVFIASCALVLILPIGYAMLSNTSVGEQLNVYTKMYTGEIFFRVATYYGIPYL